MSWVHGKRWYWGSLWIRLFLQSSKPSSIRCSYFLMQWKIFFLFFTCNWMYLYHSFLLGNDPSCLREFLLRTFNRNSSHGNNVLQVSSYIFAWLSLLAPLPFFFNIYSCMRFSLQVLDRNWHGVLAGTCYPYFLLLDHLME